MTTATYEQILFEQRGRVGLVTFNRPDRLNPWSRVMAQEICGAIQRCNEDEGIGAVVLTGAGRGYCSGAEIRPAQPATGGIGDPRELVEGFGPDHDPIPVFFHKSKPIVCAINGPAVGIGLTHALVADARIASDRARLGAVFVRVGFTPELASTHYLPQVAGLQNALELMLTGRIVDAQEALRLGLVNRVVAHESLIDEALAFAAQIAANPSWQTMQTKRMVWEHESEQDTRKVLAAEDPAFAEASRTPARQEAIRAFIEKREPQFH
jgi:2-(1,2-epoxy-1,2-dihydrophenyl)acetyl-CoA isomerase